MLFQSTRGGVKGVSFSEVLLANYAADGGLFVPESLPQVSRQQLRKWAGLDYQQLLQEVLSLFVSPDELSPGEMQGVTVCMQHLSTSATSVYDMRASSSTDLFAGVFDTPQVVPVRKVGPVHVAETWHGPTGVFKDLTLPVLARLCSHFLEKRGERATILMSTTGDTGSATIHSALHGHKEPPSNRVLSTLHGHSRARAPNDNNRSRKCDCVFTRRDVR